MHGHFELELAVHFKLESGGQYHWNLQPGSKTSSEVVSQWAKGAKVVKAFNTLYANVLAKNPQVADGNRVIFYSGNDQDSKDVVSGIINTIGFAGIDLGTLHEGGKLQRFPGGPLPTLNLIRTK